MQQQTVADQAAVDEQEDRVAVELLELRARDEAAQGGKVTRLGGAPVSAVRRQGTLSARLAREIDQFFQVWLPKTW